MQIYCTIYLTHLFYIEIILIQYRDQNVFFSKQNYNISVNTNQGSYLQNLMKKIDQYSYNSYDAIGKGYSSQVYKGKNDQTDQSVAIKLIDMKFIKGQVHRKLLQSQISILKALKRQENIIQLFDVYNTKANTCIVTELCDQDLAKTIKTKKSFSEGEAMSVLRQIINGYKSIHQSDIIHRDLKPANIFFSNKQIKIADFGFAVRASEIKKRQNYNVGSPVYMPYEALNDNIYSFKSDIWAIGVIFFEMLTGKTPWRAKTETDLKRQLKSTPIKNLLPSKIGKQSSEFLIKALAFDPEHRLSPQEMCFFFDRNHGQLQLGIKPRQMFSVSNKVTGPFKCKSRASSQQRSSRNDELSQNNISGPRTYKKLNILRGVGEETAYESKFLRTRANTKDRADESSFEIDPKKVSNQLVSQLHLCRFLFKLIQRMQKNGSIDENKQLQNQMCETIFQKLEGIKNLTLLDGQTATEFRLYPEFNKIYKICDQYSQKYQATLNYNKSRRANTGNIDGTINNEIRSLYSFIMEGCQNPEQVRDQVILLDYLITLKQLLVLDIKVGIQDFSKRSKIEDIVEGKPTAHITKDHITAINTKIKAMKIM